jgi:DNA-nicking Smr family endonuclease
MARRKEGGSGSAPKGSSSPGGVKEKPFYRPFAGLTKAAEKGKAAEARAPSLAATPKAVATAVPRRDPEPSAAGPEPSFADLLYGVKPLAGKAGQAPRVTKAEAAPEPAPAPPDPGDEAVRAHLRSLVEGGRADRFEVTDDGRVLEGARPEVDRASFRRLRRGEWPVDGRLDLHGLTAGGAREAVEAFVRRSRARGDRVLLLVHGKGEHSPGGRGVLRGEIAAWLSQGEASHAVAAFATATNDDGGEGALYVLLRRG